MHAPSNWMLLYYKNIAEANESSWIESRSAMVKKNPQESLSNNPTLLQHTILF
jgi:hypothetical protein